MLRSFSRYFPFILLVVVVFFFSQFIFPSFFDGDIRFFQLESLKEGFFTNVWMSSSKFGENYQAINRVPLEFFFLEKIPLLLRSPEIGYFFWAILPYPIFTYILASRFSRYFHFDTLSQGAIFLFLTFSTYGLASMSQGHTPLVLGFLGAAIAFFVLLDFLEEPYPDLLTLFQFLLFFQFSILYDLRMAYVFFFIYAALLLIEWRKITWRHFRLLSLLGVITILLNLYWILPLIVGGMGDGIGRDIFAPHFWTLPYAITLFHPFWNIHEEIMWFRPDLPIPVMYYLYPAVAFYICARYWRRPKVIFFSFIFLIGVFLSKSTNAPFGEVYAWLYKHFPGFSAFREPTKFYILPIFSMAFFIGLFLKEAKGWIKWAVFFTLIGISTINAYHIFSGNAGSYFSQKIVDSSYDMFPENKEGNYNVLWVPMVPKHAYCSHVVGCEHGADMLDVGNIFDDKDAFERYLIEHNVLYVALPVDDAISQDNLYVWFKNTDQYFYDKVLAQYPYLKRKEYGNLVTYEYIPYSNKHIYTSNGTFSIDEVSPSEFLLSLFGISNTTDITLLESYNKGWKLYLEPYEGDDCGGKFYCNLKKKISETGLPFIIEKSDTYLTHTKLYGYANIWIFDVESIKKHYPKEYYHENPDGSLDLRLSLVFLAQSYFYLGIIIGIVTLAGCIIYLAYRDKHKHLS